MLRQTGEITLGKGSQLEKRLLDSPFSSLSQEKQHVCAPPRNFPLLSAHVSPIKTCFWKLTHDKVDVRIFTCHLLRLLASYINKSAIIIQSLSLLFVWAVSDRQHELQTWLPSGFSTLSALLAVISSAPRTVLYQSAYVKSCLINKNNSNISWLNRMRVSLTTVYKAMRIIQAKWMPNLPHPSGSLWLLNLLRSNSSHDSHSHFIGQSKLHGRGQKRVMSNVIMIVSITTTVFSSH